MNMGRVFVVGCPRSGTTLVQSFLAAHPAVASFPETHFFVRMPAWNRDLRMLGFAASDATRIDESLAKLVMDASVIAPVSRRMKPHARFFVDVLDTAAVLQAATVWVEKTPNHIGCIDVIERYVPDARFVHVLRDGADVVASLYEVSRKHPEQWGGPKSIERCASEWKAAVVQTWYRRGAPNMTIVQYEELITETVPVLRRLSEFIGVDYDEAMLDGRQASARAVIQDGERWKQQAAGPVVDTRRRTFLRVFDQAQRERVLTLVAEAGRQTPGSLASPVRPAGTLDGRG